MEDSLLYWLHASGHAAGLVVLVGGARLTFALAGFVRYQLPRLVDGITARWSREGSRPGRFGALRLRDGKDQ